MPTPFGAGGTIVLAYTNGQDRWELRLPVADFDPSSLLYTGAGAYVPAETGLVQTFAALASLWAPYFDPSWSLSLEAIFHQSGATGTKLASVPTVGTVQGTSGVASSANPPIKRGFSFVSALRNVQRVRLFSVATNQVGAARVCTASSGGFDGRDQQLVAYLCSGHSGAVCWDGQPFPPSARVYQQVKLSPFEVPGPAGPAGPPGTGLPAGHTGDILFYDGTAWTTLPIGPDADELTVTPVGTRLLPRWQPCCGADSIPPTPIVGIDPGGGGTDTGTGRITSACGAAVYMAQGLEGAYNDLATYLNMGLTQGLVIAGTAFITTLFDILTAGFGIPLDGLVAGGVFALAQILLKSLHVVAWGPLSPTQQNTILEACFCALPRDTTSFTVDSLILQQWRANLAASGSVFSTGQINVLKSLVGIPTLASWDYMAAAGAQQGSTLCVDFICAAGKALQGGAALGNITGKSLSGGAVLGAIGTALQGGAQLTNLNRRSLSGGAKTS